MTLASYPPELPQPVRADFQVQRGDGRTRTQQDAGPHNVRRRYSSVATTVTITTLLSRDQLARFDRFYDDEIRQGTLPFLMLDHATDGWQQLDDEGQPMLTDDGIPLLLAETWLCLMGSRLPNVSLSGVTFKVTFDIAVMP